MPLLPKLKPYLDECFELAEPGTEYVITRYRNINANLRTQLLRIIKRAGLKPWPKLFQNLRSTRQTELEESFPSHVVCSWIGNSEAVAKKHYLQVTDEHFEKALHNAMQQPHVTGCNDSQVESTAHEKPPVLQGGAAGCDSLHHSQMDDTGLEHTANSTQKTSLSEKGAAESDAVGARNGPIDPGLQAIIQRWPELPDAVKTGILAMVRTSGDVK